MTTRHGSKDFWLSALRTDGPLFREAIGTPGALAAAVPPCPPWRVEDLVHHLGGVYAWLRGHVARGRTSAPEPRRPGAYPAGAAALAWWDDQYAGLLALLDRLDPELPAWNWAPRPKTAVFWHRRAAHETAVHRWDAQVAVGRVEPIEAHLAADGVSEVLDSWLPAGRRKAATDRHGIAELQATDTGTQWYVRLRADGGVALLDTDTLLDTDDPPARVHARGTASDLMLALYGRVPFDVLDVTGAGTLLGALRTG